MRTYFFEEGNEFFFDRGKGERRKLQCTAGGGQMRGNFGILDARMAIPLAHVWLHFGSFLGWKLLQRDI